MAGGIPVVAKKDECIENIITDGETGMLFEKNEDLPELLYRVLTDKALSEKLSTASIQAMDVLSVQNFADSVEQLYQNILEQEERPQAHRRPCYSVRDWRKGRQGHYRAAREDFPYLFKESSKLSFFCQGRIKSKPNFHRV